MWTTTTPVEERPLARGFPDLRLVPSRGINTACRTHSETIILTRNRGESDGYDLGSVGDGILSSAFDNHHDDVNHDSGITTS
jgi:hypothetical protein